MNATMSRSRISLRAITRLPLAPARPRPSPAPWLGLVQPLQPSRPLSSTLVLLKKRKIAPASDSPSPPYPSHPGSHHKSTSTARKHAPPPSSEPPSPAPDPENPLDMSVLTGAYAAADAHFRAEIQNVLHGGRFNPDSLGSVPVTLKPAHAPSSTAASSSSSSSSSHAQHSAANPAALETFQLRELAQIVPRSGRTISLLVNDKKYIKDIMSAIQKSNDFNQQPQRSDDNELELFLKVELERKDDLIKRVRDACRAWRDRVRQARTKHEKTLQDWRKNKLVLPDVVRKAEKEMQKLQDRKMKDIDVEEAQALKQLDRH